MAVVKMIGREKVSEGGEMCGTWSVRSITHVLTYFRSPHRARVHHADITRATSKGCQRP